MEQEIIIRRLVADDLDDLYPLFEEMLRSDIPEIASRSEFFLSTDYTKSRIQSNLLFPKIAMFGAFVEGRLAGFIWGNSTYAGLGFISWLKVDRKLQKNGIGKKLVGHYEQYVKGKDGHVVELYCFENMKDFYLKQGYEIIGIREKGYFKLKQFILNKYI